MRVGQGRRALWAVGAVSFLESAILPLPVDAVSVPVMLADRSRIGRVVLVATAASVLGGTVGYALGLLLYHTVVTWLIGLYGWQAAFAEVQQDFHRHGALIVAVGSVTPVPYKLIAIASGVERLPFPLFLAISIAGRGLRFAFFGLLIWRFGPAIRTLLDRHARIAGWLVLILLVGGFLLVELLR